MRMSVSPDMCYRWGCLCRQICDMCYRWGCLCRQICDVRVARYVL
ncbi:hypothetical protein LSH36_5g18006 [Paralvinella palmiformis]|uniref:Uncharacterized protein n=1 Tax=Paralvinella palmiformis TaxID=53620 RepID=A0AAD9KGD0_9ANNE|nr:hypothetical protein LSH36_5g18006 [Paralvinella palmiformis]